MRAVRYLLATLGIVALCLGLAATVDPTIVEYVPIDEAVDWLGNDYLLVGTVGLAAFVSAIVVAGLWAIRGIDQATPPEPERVATGPHPGVEFDRFLADGWSLRRRLFGDERRRVRDRLDETTVRTLMRTIGCSRDDARERIDRGTWTDDRRAAAFLGGESAPSPSWRERIDALIRGEPWFEHGARQTVEAIVSLTDEADGEET